MAHTTKGRTFHRERNQRRALLRSLARSLVVHGHISTTEAKAKALRPFIERLVSYAKANTLATRRFTVAKLGDPVAAKKLFTVIAPRYSKRTGGYTRVVKRTKRGTSDARRLAYIAFV